MSQNDPAPRRRRSPNYAPYALFFLAVLFLFVGGGAAILYLLFSQYSGVRNLWLLACGAPVVLVVLVVYVLFSLYTRFGKPLRDLFKTINEVEAGNLAARVPESRSEMFSELFKRFNKMVGELERAETQRRNLTADIAHELRTPLHIIQGNLEGILDGIYPPGPETINITLDETRLLTRLVNDLQTLSLVETGQLPLHPAHFQLADLLHDIETSFAAQAAAVGVELHTRPGDPEQSISADYDRLNQVLTNLVSNALRHTPPGGSVTIVTDTGPDPARPVRITVSDTGQGIAPADLPFIFDRFWRSDRARTGRTHSGLGLAITRQLVHVHGGGITAHSEPGKGTVFIIELPLGE